MSTKPYLYLICEKEVKSTSGPTKYLNICKGYFYSKLSHEPLQHKSHNKKDILGRNWEDKSDLLGEIVIIAIIDGMLKTPTENTL